MTWALEYACPLRTGDNWMQVGETFSQLSSISAYVNAIRRGDVVDGVCVVGHGYHNIPTFGFRVEEQLGSFGGVDAIKTNCGECVANVCLAHDSEALATCFGYVSLEPQEVEIEMRLRQGIKSLDAADAFSSTFVRSKPLWYGLWCQSPLTVEQCRLLEKLFDVARLDDLKSTQRQCENLPHFMGALRTAIDRSIPLHVRLAPPGHTDEGVITTFAHCPRCKAIWNEEKKFNSDKLPKSPVKCRVCGWNYVPSETYCSREFGPDYHPFDNSLESLLGPEHVTPFQERYLIEKGMTPKQAKALLKSREAMNARGYAIWKSLWSSGVWLRGWRRRRRLKRALLDEPVLQDDGRWIVMEFAQTRTQVIYDPVSVSLVAKYVGGDSQTVDSLHDIY